MVAAPSITTAKSCVAQALMQSFSSIFEIGRTSFQFFFLQILIGCEKEEFGTGLLSNASRQSGLQVFFSQKNTLSPINNFILFVTHESTQIS
jgi:hypothetical protein